MEKTIKINKVLIYLLWFKLNLTITKNNVTISNIEVVEWKL